MTIELPNNWEATDRGNTVLRSPDSNAMVAWLALPNGRRLEISYNPENYPALEVTVLSEQASSDENLAKHIQKNLAEWLIVRLNIPDVKEDGGAVAYIEGVSD